MQQSYTSGVLNIARLKILPEIRYTKGGKTERSNKPDFLFPDHASYSNPAFATDRLTMLAAKSVCKERWRQILPEADRIVAKHLVTIEPGISSAQTDQMQSHAVQLVVPLSLQASYTKAQSEWLWSMDRFVQHVRGLQLSV